MLLIHEASGKSFSSAHLPCHEHIRGMAAKFHALHRSVLDEDEWSASHSASFIFKDMTLVTRFWKWWQKEEFCPIKNQILFLLPITSD
jgi:hypothetical protein